MCICFPVEAKLQQSRCRAQQQASREPTMAECGLILRPTLHLVVVGGLICLPTVSTSVISLVLLPQKVSELGCMCPIQCGRKSLGPAARQPLPCQYGMPPMILIMTAATGCRLEASLQTVHLPISMQMHPRQLLLAVRFLGTRVRYARCDCTCFNFRWLLVYFKLQWRRCCCCGSNTTCVITSHLHPAPAPRHFQCAQCLVSLVSCLVLTCIVLPSCLVERAAFERRNHNHTDAAS